MNKKRKEAIRLVSTAGSGYFYMTHKKKIHQKRMQVMKYDPKVKKHVLYIEKKSR
jgi:large subunit ribosomal protein L33